MLNILIILYVYFKQGSNVTLFLNWFIFYDSPYTPLYALHNIYLREVLIGRLSVVAIPMAAGWRCDLAVRWAGWDCTTGAGRGGR